MTMEQPKKNAEIARQLWRCFGDAAWEQARTLLHDDFEAIWPQSNELIKGADRFIQINREYPGTHKIEIIRVNEFAEDVVTEVFIDSTLPEGKKICLFAVSFLKIIGGKIVSAKEYWADTYSAPEWRKHLVSSWRSTDEFS